MQNHPLYGKVTDMERVIQFQSRNSNYIPFYVHAVEEVNKIISKYPISTDNIENRFLSGIEPWCFSNINMDFSFAKINKRDMSSYEVQQKFLDLINTKYSLFDLFFTDGSVVGDKAGFAVFNQNLTIVKRITNFSSIYTSELLAIRTCIENIENIAKDSLIITDSKSSLEGLQDPFSKNIIIQQIRTIISSKPNQNITFLWVPSHLSIRGNEQVDGLAKSSLNQNVSIEYKYQYSDYRQYIGKYIFDIWNDSWKNNNDSKLFEIQKNIPHKFVIPNISKTDLIKLNRLKIGHCLFSHKHVVEKSPPPVCNCGQLLNIKHIFNECTHLHEARVKYKVHNIKVLQIEHKFENIKKFLIEINMYNKI